jgi:hypothetical protein
MRGFGRNAARVALAGALAMGLTIGLATAPAGAKKAAKKPTIVITGDFKVKKATTLRCLQLQKITPTAANRSVALTAPPAKKPLPGDGSYELDVNAVALGTTTTFPPASTGNPSTTPTIRFSYNTNGDYLDWGGPATTGTVTLAADGNSGTVDLQIPFFGDDNRTVPATAHKAVHVKGAFKCPPGP